MKVGRRVFEIEKFALSAEDSDYDYGVFNAVFALNHGDKSIELHADTHLLRWDFNIEGRATVVVYDLMIALTKLPQEAVETVKLVFGTAHNVEEVVKMSLKAASEFIVPLIEPKGRV